MAALDAPCMSRILQFRLLILGGWALAGVAVGWYVHVRAPALWVWALPLALVWFAGLGWLLAGFTSPGGRGRWGARVGAAALGLVAWGGAVRWYEGHQLRAARHARDASPLVRAALGRHVDPAHCKETFTDASVGAVAFTLRCGRREVHIAMTPEPRRAWDVDIRWSR